jgi:hypothetical protein
MIKVWFSDNASNLLSAWLVERLCRRCATLPATARFEMLTQVTSHPLIRTAGLTQFDNDMARLQAAPLSDTVRPTEIPTHNLIKVVGPFQLRGLSKQDCSFTPVAAIVLVAPWVVMVIVAVCAPPVHGSVLRHLWTKRHVA